MIEAKETPIENLFTEGKNFIIPNYQRPYSWGEEQALQLIEDIYTAYNQSSCEYFIGCIICIEKNKDIYEIVDGQQRLTTLVLLFVALGRIMDNLSLKNDMRSRIVSEDSYSDLPPEPRLKVRDKEFDFYANYILEEKKLDKPSKLTYTESRFDSNLEVMINYIKKLYDEDVDLRQVSKFILKNVYVVFVKTADQSSSFRFFNVLNSRGLPLTNADLVKNDLFEAANNSVANIASIDKAWKSIEDNVSVENIDSFLTIHLLSEKKDRDRNLGGVINGFKLLLNGSYRERPQELARHIKRSSDNYRKIIDADFSSYKLQKIIYFLNNLGSDEWIAPVLAFMNRNYLVKSDGANESEREINLEEFIHFFEKIYMHSWFTNASKSKRESSCYTALVAINKGYSLDEIISEVCKDEDQVGFEKSLDENIYEPRPLKTRLIKAILLRLDVEKQDESVLKTYRGRITIEHIMPQNISDVYWSSRFSEDEHTYWVHKLGNLTLISGSKNSEAQNISFYNKKKVYLEKTKRTSFEITRDICLYEEWDLNSIADRHDKIKKQILSIWSYFK